jgi:hypothetical protein
MGFNLGRLWAREDPGLASYVRDLIYFNKVTEETFILTCERFNKIKSPSIRQVMYMQLLGDEARKLAHRKGMVDVLPGILNPRM